MKRNSLFLFLSLMFVWAGLCSAQTTSDKYYLIDGYFFNGMPPGIRNAQGDRFVMLKDDEGHMALEIRLPKGKNAAGVRCQISDSGRRSTRRGRTFENFPCGNRTGDKHSQQYGYP